MLNPTLQACIHRGLPRRGGGGLSGTPGTLPWLRHCDETFFRFPSSSCNGFSIPIVVVVIESLLLIFFRFWTTLKFEYGICFAEGSNAR